MLELLKLLLHTVKINCRLTCDGFNLLMIVDFPLLSNPTHSTAAVFFFNPSQRAKESKKPMILLSPNQLITRYCFCAIFVYRYVKMPLAWCANPDIHGFHRNTGWIIFNCCKDAILLKLFKRGECCCSPVMCSVHVVLFVLRVVMLKDQFCCLFTTHKALTVAFTTCLQTHPVYILHPSFAEDYKERCRSRLAI